MTDASELVRRLRFWIPIIGSKHLEDDLAEAADRLEALEAELGNLLAIIHRDGGHHTGKVGYRKSVEDAHLVWAKMREEADRLEALEAENKRLREALEQASRQLHTASRHKDAKEIRNTLESWSIDARAALKGE
jgi:DNA repair ATPase RecN